MRKLKLGLAALLAAASLGAPVTRWPVPDPSGGSTRTGRPHRRADGLTGEFVVFYADGVIAADVRAAVAGPLAGPWSTRSTRWASPRSPLSNAGFVTRALMASGKAKGVVRNHSVGSNTKGAAHRFVNKLALEDRATPCRPRSVPEAPGRRPRRAPRRRGRRRSPSLQWGMQMIGATPNLAHATAPVTVSSSGSSTRESTAGIRISRRTSTPR